MTSKVDFEKNGNLSHVDRHLTVLADKAIRQANLVGSGSAGTQGHVVYVDQDGDRYQVEQYGRIVASGLTKSQAHQRIVKLLSK